MILDNKPTLWLQLSAQHKPPIEVEGLPSGATLSDSETYGFWTNRHLEYQPMFDKSFVVEVNSSMEGGLAKSC